MINEFKDGQFVQEAKWAIAECTINLSRWSEGRTAYRGYVAAYPKDGKVAEAGETKNVLHAYSQFIQSIDAAKTGKQN